jgi:type II secretory pathway pseudopilin PulG
MSPQRDPSIHCAGFSLIEVIVFIVVLGVLLAGLIVSLASPLRNSPEAGRLDLAAELAQQRMELILAQRRAAGFAAFTDPCSPGPGPAICTPPAGYTITSSIASGFGADPTNYKVISVAITGNASITATALVGNY